MKKTGLILVVQSILCVLLALLLIAAVIGIYRDGAAARAEDPLARIFTPADSFAEAPVCCAKRSASSLSDIPKYTLQRTLRSWLSLRSFLAAMVCWPSNT